jgi:cytochrome c peroxidase
MRVLALLLALQIPLGLDRGLLAPPHNPVTREKAQLGRRLFFDRKLSADNSLACADCHRPERAFSDERRVAVGVLGRRGHRNVPAILNRTYGRAFFWDGRVTTLEEQVLLPIRHPKEMGADLPTLIQRLRADATYQTQFEEIFGRPPDAGSLSHALATYVRTLFSGASGYDRYEAGETRALSPLAQRGLRLFRGRARCTRCHSGSNFTDEDFHNTGVSWGRQPHDPGRFVVTGLSEDTGSFKTPTLREVEHTAPYMHDGSLATLEDVIEFYDRGGNANPYRDRDLRRLSLTADEKGALLAFLKSLSGQIHEGLD